MSEISGLPSALGIEAIDIEPTVGGGMNVRVAGRWPRGRPDWDGPPILALGSGEERRRVHGTIDSPDELSAAWRVSFAVPDELVPRLDGLLWLGLGSVMVPLSVATVPDDTASPGMDPELLLSRELRTLEATARVARRAQAAAEARADALEAEVERLRHELAEARREPERLAALAADRDRLRRQAEQREYAEAARREELEGELHELDGEVEALRVRLRDRSARIHELERELRHARRTADEARQAALLGARSSGHGPAPARAPVATPTGRSPAPVTNPSGRAPAPRRRQARVLGTEFALLRRLAPVPKPATPRSRLVPSASLAAERSLAGHRRVSGGRATADASAELAAVRARLTELSEALVRERARTAELEAALAHERASSAERLAALQSDVARQRENAMRALETIAAFRRELASPPSGRDVGAEPSAPSDAPASPEPAEAVQADRLAAALSRLRERVPDPSASAAQEAEAPAAASATPMAASSSLPAHGAGAAATDALPRVFRALAAEEPAAAGRLVLGVLPLQHLVQRRPVAYDLALDAGAYLHVTSGPGGTTVEPATAPRPAEATQFSLAGSPAALARLLAAGPVRRRLGRGIARVHGDRRALTALDALVRTRLPLRAFVAGGARLDPLLALRLAAAAIDPGLTRAERFTLAHRPAADAPATATLHVSDGRPLAVTDLPLAGTATCTIVCAPDAVLGTLLDPVSAGTELLGDERALRVVHGWLARA